MDATSPAFYEAYQEAKRESEGRVKGVELQIDIRPDGNLAPGATQTGVAAGAMKDPGETNQSPRHRDQCSAERAMRSGVRVP
jgi:hypothetical protein